MAKENTAEFRFDHDGKVVFFDKHVDLADNTLEQVAKMAALPFVKRMAVMPDAHLGMGATIGTVSATQDAIIPAAVGVDIGCGIDAYFVGAKREEIPDHQLQEILHLWRKNIPHGRTANGGHDDVGKHFEKNYVTPEHAKLLNEYRAHAQIARGEHPYVIEHMGTLGTGNHFIELAQDDDGDLWLLVHSGSRGPGARLANYYTAFAKQTMQQYFIDLPDPDLAYLVKSMPEYNTYIGATMWAQRYAATNRWEMATTALAAIEKVTQLRLKSEPWAQTPHNFLRQEKHNNMDVWVTRKGASSALGGEPVCIPGSMGTKSFLCVGTGSKMSMTSSSHGAGRAMSRGDAKRTFSLEDHIKALGDVITSNAEDTVDETPGAYKNIDDVIASQKTLVEVNYELTPVLNMKG